LMLIPWDPLYDYQSFILDRIGKWDALKTKQMLQNINSTE